MVTAEPTEPPGYPEEFMCDTFYEEHLKGGTVTSNFIITLGAIKRKFPFYMIY